GERAEENGVLHVEDEEPDVDEQTVDDADDELAAHDAVHAAVDAAHDILGLGAVALGDDAAHEGVHAADVDEDIGRDQEHDDELQDGRDDAADARLAKLQHLRDLALEPGEDAQEALADELLEPALGLLDALAHHHPLVVDALDVDAAAGQGDGV